MSNNKGTTDIDGPITAEDLARDTGFSDYYIQHLLSSANIYYPSVWRSSGGDGSSLWRIGNGRIIARTRKGDILMLYGIYATKEHDRELHLAPYEEVQDLMENHGNDPKPQICFPEQVSRI